MSILETHIKTNGLVEGYVSGKHADICRARTMTVQAFMSAHSAPWLWSVDTDMVWKPEDLPALLELADPVQRPIIGAAYVADDRKLTWRTMDETGLHPAKRVPKYARPIQVASIGMGFSLIHRSVLERMRDAYGEDPWPWFGNDVIEIDGKRDRLGDDVTFCARAIRLGFSVWGAGVRVEHRKTIQLAA